MARIERHRLLKFLLLGAAFSGIMIALNLFASATAVVRHPAIAVPLGLLVGFAGAAGMLAWLWGDSDE